MLCGLLFGTFDGIHLGHIHIFLESKKFVDYITVIVARDQTVLKVKNRLPDNDETSRLIALQNNKYVDQAILGSLIDKYQAIKDIKPNIIFLGYDQIVFVDGLMTFIKSNDLDIEIIRLDSFHPEKYKSSLLRKKINLDVPNND